MSSLCHLLEQPRAADFGVARRLDPASRTEQTIRWRQLRRDVAGLHRRIAGRPEGAWVLLTEDAYAFAVGLLALWHSGRYAISPPNRQAGTLRMLQTRAAGVLSDRPDWFPDGSCIHPLADAGDGDPASLVPPGRDAFAVELYTSGTTGAEKPVCKRIRHLEDEVEQLDATWGERVAGATVFSTAPHQHLYGLLFGVLWPLCAGRTFWGDHFLHLGELVPRLREAEDCVLVSVPTHLKRLARHAEAATLRGHCRALFSSGGPLPRETAQRLAGLLGRAPLEVLGSTETGGIAWRAQEPDAGDVPWTPFSAVRVARDPSSGVARVSSPFVSADESAEGFAIGDRIVPLADGRFALEGRSDRVVKVGEKRLDLAQMESQLRGHPCVDEVAATTVERDGELRVAAAVVPTARGRERLRREGRRALGRALAESLAEDWDPVLHPRHWRFAARLPENAQGKVTRDALLRLFRETPADDGDAEGPARRREGAP